METETNMSTQSTLIIRKELTTGLWSVWSHLGFWVADFNHESDARSYVAGEKATEELERCKAFIREVATDRDGRASPGLKVEAMDLLSALTPSGGGQ